MPCYSIQGVCIYILIVCFGVLICTLHIPSCAALILLYVYNKICLFLICLNCSSVVLGIKYLNMLNCISLPSLPVSILLAILHFLCLKLFLSLVIITDLTVSDLMLLESSVSMLDQFLAILLLNITHISASCTWHHSFQWVSGNESHHLLHNITQLYIYLNCLFLP